MTLNNILEAIASKLVGIWTDRHVFVNEIPKDSDGNFFVGIIETSQEKKLDRRRVRHIQIEVLYFLSNKDNMDFNEWVESMYDHFESLSVYEKTVDGSDVFRSVRLTNIKARKDGDARVYQIGGNLMAKNKPKAASAGQAPDEAVYTKEQLVKCKTLGVPVDAVTAILKDDQTYTKKQAISLVSAFLERKV